MSARQAADPFLQERIRCCAQPLRPPDRASPGLGKTRRRGSLTMVGLRPPSVSLPPAPFSS
jgi:hypothetical protein